MILTTEADDNLIVRTRYNSYLGHVPNTEAWNYFWNNPVEAISSFTVNEMIEHLGFMDYEANDAMHKAALLSYIAHYYADGNEDYFKYHIVKVAETANLNMLVQRMHSKEMSNSEIVMPIAYLHDTIEDTDLDGNLIKRLPNGTQIYINVASLTDIPAPTRQERKIGSYERIRNAGTDAVYIKYCDRSANYHRCMAEVNTKKMKMYINEHEHFVWSLSNHGFGSESSMRQLLENQYKDMISLYEKTTKLVV